MKSLSRNLYKSGHVVLQGNDKKVIDTNAAVARKIEELSGTMALSAMGENAMGFTQEDFADDFSEGIRPDHVAVLLEGAEENESHNVVIRSGPDREELLKEARNEIEEMKQAAVAEVEVMKKNAYDQAFEQGKNDGYAAGYQAGLKKNQDREQKLAQMEAELEADYHRQMAELEPQLVDTLTGIYEHIFKVDLANYRGIILHLIGATLQRIGNARDYIIHVSKEDYPYVGMQKQQIVEQGSVGVASVEIVEDTTLGKNECLIETDGGIFDCSLGVQLADLTKQLRLLSYSGQKE